jgi:hypothetical protein
MLIQEGTAHTQINFKIMPMTLGRFYSGDNSAVDALMNPRWRTQQEC